MQHVMRIAHVAYREDVKRDISLRVITDHIRSTTMMIGDGVLPSNEGRGYVLRRLLRRAARHGRLLGICEPFLAQVAGTVIAENRRAYPQLAEKQAFIQKVIAHEEEIFGNTIDAGLQLLSRMAEGLEGKTLSGAEAFKLGDTYGFPIDLTKEILLESNISVNIDEYQALAKQQRERSRAARKEAGGWDAAGNPDIKGLPATEFLGYAQEQAEAEVLAIYVNGELEDYTTSEAVLVLDCTPFYAESGGQCGDMGTLQCGGTIFLVKNTTSFGGVTLHHGSVKSGDGLWLGDKVQATVAPQRQDIRRNHTAAHLLQAALRQVLGSHVEQAGQSVTPRSVRFDFTHFAALTQEELHQTEALVNQMIWAALPVETELLPREEAKARGAMALFGEKYGTMVRMVQVGDFSKELCGGTHVENTGNLGLFLITSESSVASGVRRMEAVTAANAYALYNEKQAQLEFAAGALKANSATDLIPRAKAVVRQLKETEQALAAAQETLSRYAVQEFLQNAAEYHGVRFVCGELASAEGLRRACDIARQSDKTIVALFGAKTNKGTLQFAAACAENAVTLGAHAGLLVKAAAQAAGGTGGGKADSAMAGGKNPAKLREALAAGEAALRAMLNQSEEG
jgi:alanyl-tRNA synthetase